MPSDKEDQSDSSTQDGQDDIVSEAYAGRGIGKLYDALYQARRSTGIPLSVFDQLLYEAGRSYLGDEYWTEKHGPPPGMQSPEAFHAPAASSALTMPSKEQILAEKAPSAESSLTEKVTSMIPAAQFAMQEGLGITGLAQMLEQGTDLSVGGPLYALGQIPAEIHQHTGLLGRTAVEPSGQYNLGTGGIGARKPTMSMEGRLMQMQREDIGNPATPQTQDTELDPGEIDQIHQWLQSQSD